MQKITEVLGIKIARQADLQSEAKKVEKQQKRVKHFAKVSFSKEFFKTLEQDILTKTTAEEKIDLLLSCFIHLGHSLAHIENILFDNLGDPYRDNV